MAWGAFFEERTNTMTNTQWEKMVGLLSKRDNTRCLWHIEGRNTQFEVEGWNIGPLVVVFVIYKTGGFDLYTPHQAPREIDELLPWLDKEIQTL